jgi:hypothetical protein
MAGVARLAISQVNLVVERYGQLVSYQRIIHRCTVPHVCNRRSCLLWTIDGLNFGQIRTKSSDIVNLLIC